MLDEKNFQPLHLTPPSILLVIEDSEEDYDMLSRAVKKSNIQCELYHCDTGQKALDLLKNQHQYQNTKKFRKPSLILLDLNLPGTDGRKILEKIKSDAVLKLIPVVIFTTSSNRKDIEDCYKKGANAYCIKPMNIALLQEYVTVLLSHWLQINVI
jgi:CheY-like chemotaxis protein